MTPYVSRQNEEEECYGDAPSWWKQWYWFLVGGGALLIIIVLFMLLHKPKPQDAQLGFGGQ